MPVRDRKIAKSFYQSKFRSSNFQLKSRNGANAALCFTLVEPYAGEFERRRSASQRGVWGSVPPDPGSALTGKVATYKFSSFADVVITSITLNPSAYQLTPNK